MSEVVINISRENICVKSKILFKFFLIKEFSFARFFKTDIVLYVPGYLDFNDVGKFLKVLDDCNTDIVKCALEERIHPDVIFVISDYLGIEVVFEEISMKYSQDFKISPYFLKQYVNTFSICHPNTIELYENFISAFKIPRLKFSAETILNSSISKIKELTRNFQRRTTHLDELYLENCYACKVSFIFKLTYLQDGTCLPEEKASLLPCCGMLVHTKCVRKLISRKNSYMSVCKVCSSKLLYGGSFSACNLIDPARDKRNEIRKSRGFTPEQKLPYLNLDKVFGYC